MEEVSSNKKLFEVFGIKWSVKEKFPKRKHSPQKDIPLYVNDTVQIKLSRVLYLIEMVAMKKVNENKYSQLIKTNQTINLQEIPL